MKSSIYADLRQTRYQQPKPSFFETAKKLATASAELAADSAPFAASSSVALTAVLYTTGVLAANTCLPVCVGMIIGLLPASMSEIYLQQKYLGDDIFDDKPYASAMFLFVLRASTQILGILIGLAIASMVVTLTMNPFTTPALIAGGVSATIILGLFLYLNHRVKQAVVVMERFQDEPWSGSISNTNSNTNYYNHSSSANTTVPIKLIRTSPDLNMFTLSNRSTYPFGGEGHDIQSSDTEYDYNNNSSSVSNVKK